MTPVLFILVTVALIGSDLHDQGWRAAAGVLIAALGWPVYHGVLAEAGRCELGVAVGLQGKKGSRKLYVDTVYLTGELTQVVAQCGLDVQRDAAAVFVALGSGN